MAEETSDQRSLAPALPPRVVGRHDAFRSVESGGGLAGRMQVRGILGSVVADLGCRIVSGEWLSGETLPIENEMIAHYDVSRSVVREAVRMLNAKGLLRSRQMAGTKVLPRAEWRHLDPDVIGWRIQAGDRKTLLDDLLHVRRVLEPGVARHAATHAAEACRARFSEAWRIKQSVFSIAFGTPQEQRAAYIASDLEFHRSLLASAESELLLQLFTVIEAALALLFDLQMKARGSTTSLSGMEESMQLHAAVHDAVASRDGDAAEKAMRNLIERAIFDAERGFAILG